MKEITSRLAALVFISVFAAFAANAQSNDSKKKRALKITAKVAEFTFKTTAKAVVETGKFVGEHVIVPFAKDVAWPVAKAAPPLAAKGIKLTAKGVTKGIRAVTKDHEDSKSLETDSGK